MTLFRSFLIAVMFTLIGSSAYALKGVGTVDNLEFITDTNYGGYALCHHVEHIAIKSIPITSESVGYALAGNQCDTYEFIALSTEEFLQGQADGYFPADLPAVPSLSKAQFALNVVAYGGLIVFVIGGLLWKFGYLRRSERALNNTGLLQTGLSGAKDVRIPLSRTAQTRMLAAVCYVAQADGAIEGDEVIGIGKMISKFTGEKVNFSSVVDMIHHTAANTDVSVLDSLGDGIKQREGQKILEAAVTIAMSDKDVHPNEVAVINRIAAALGLPAPDLRTQSGQPAFSPAMA